MSSRADRTEVARRMAVAIIDAVPEDENGCIEAGFVIQAGILALAMVKASFELTNPPGHYDA